MTQVLTGLHAVTLHIRDIEIARKFYRDTLGLAEQSFDPVAHRAVFSLPGTSTLLTMHIQAPGEGGRDPGTVSGIVFHHPNPVEATEEFRRRGGTVTMEPQPVKVGTQEFVRCAIADPDGNEFVISNRKD